MYTCEEEDVDKILLVTNELFILSVNLDSFEITEVCNFESFRPLLKSTTTNKMRSYDKIITLSHFNPHSQQLFIHFANSKLFSMMDLKSKSLAWNLPNLQNCGTPLSMTSDLEKLLVAYDSNKMILFDLLNKRLHDWTRESLEKLPQNFLQRYNRLIGVTQFSDTKYILYSNYTYQVLDISRPLP